MQILAGSLIENKTAADQDFQSTTQPVPGFPDPSGNSAYVAKIFGVKNNDPVRLTQRMVSDNDGFCLLYCQYCHLILVFSFQFSAFGCHRFSR